METSIRQANISDVDPIRFLFRDTIIHVNSKDYNQEEIIIWADSYKNTARWKNVISDQYFLVATIEKEIVGFASITDSGHLDYLYVHKDYQRKGVAKKLLQELEKHVQEHSVKEISAHVSKTAKPFFETNGFIKTAELRKKIGNIEFTNSVITKKI